MSKDVEVVLFDSIKDDAILKKSKEIVDVSISQLGDSGILEMLPVVSFAVKANKIIIDVRHQLFLKRILYFLTEIADASYEIREKFYFKHNNPAEIHHIGLAILELIDKSDKEKTSLIGKLFLSHLKEEIDFHDFTTASQMINASYSSDLIYFVRQANKKIDETGDEVEHLISLGFYTRMKYRFGSSVIEETQPILTDIAKRILKAVNI